MYPRPNNTLTIALSTFALGAVIAFLATIQVVDHDSDGGQPQAIGVLPPGYAPGDDVDPELLPEGFEIDDSTGEIVASDPGGNPGGEPGATPRDPSNPGVGTRPGDRGPGADPNNPQNPNNPGNPNSTCAAGQNGGATDTGVTATSIKFGATTAESGVAASFLGEVKRGMEAVRKRVNGSGGVCGRQLEISYKDDGWDPARGATAIENLIEQEQVFALAVSPSSEGVNAASRKDGGRYFQNKDVPVVGSDGLNVSQFKDPYIFPVAAATITSVDVMMENAYNRAKAQGVELHPAVVFGNTYRFGIEGAFAANAAYKKLSGRDIPGYSPNDTDCKVTGDRFCGIPDNKPQGYGDDVNAVNTACSGQCNYMILLLEPQTALSWMGTARRPLPKDLDYGIGGPQPLFTRNFATECKQNCNGMWLWTGYKPYIENYRSDPAVRKYVDDLKAQSSSADEFNQFTMGGYVGMEVLVEALKQTGPNLTRQALVSTLNSMSPVDTGLTLRALSWRPLGGDPAVRHANNMVQAFQINYGDSFSGWQLKVNPTPDPWTGQHTG